MTFDVNKDLEFRDITTKTVPERKTKVFEVWNLQEKTRIGKILWFNHWRHYVFAPYSQTVFSDRCMIKIGEVVKIMNEEHRTLLRKAKGEIWDMGKTA